MLAAPFSHLALSCQDPARTERFYTTHFGFRRVRLVDLGNDQIVFLRSGAVCLELFRATEERPVPATGNDGPHWPGLRHLAFQVENVDAKLDEMGSEAVRTLGPFNFDSFIPGWRTVWIADPDGNIVEITQGYRDEATAPITGEGAENLLPAR